ncbi:MAG: caspase family protein [Chloroflexota bacterium]|nr:MAG: caspase family protein [Chloroflexota bacterium]
MKQILVIALVLVLALSIAAPATSMTQATGGPSKVTPDDLPVVKPPMELIGGSSTPTGNPHGGPPGQEDKPDRPGKPDKETSANKWAVVVGIADYEGSEYDLWHTDEDAKEMASALTENYGFDKGNVRVLLNRKATYGAIVSAIDWLIQNEDTESTVVLFFSGHGFRAVDSEGWDSDTESDGQDEGIVSHDFYGLPDGFLQQKLSALESQKIALCFGSCHSGGMFDDASDLQGANRVIASACRADEYGWDYLLLGNTLWGKYFVDEGLLQGLADPQGDDSIEEAHAYAYLEVVGERSDSHPQLSDQYAGEFIL